MNLFKNILKRYLDLPTAVRSQPVGTNVRNRTIATNAYVPSWRSLYADAGVDVTEESAMQLATVDACINRISDDISGLPARVIQKLPNGRRKRVDHWAVRVLNEEPNELHTAAVWRALQVRSLATRGNSYSEIEWSSLRTEARLYPLYPQQVRPSYTKAGGIKYAIQTDKVETVGQGELLHCLWRPRPDGLMGRSPIETAANAIGVALAADQFAAKWFANGTHLSGYVKYPGDLEDDEEDELKKTWAEQHAGLENSHEVAVLLHGAEFVPLSVPPEQMQLLATRGYSSVDICKLFAVSPPLIGDLTKSSYSTYDAVLAAHVRLCIRPYCSLLEQEWTRKLLTEEEKRGGLKIELDTEGLMRGDRQSQDKSFATGKQFGWFSTNEIRSFMNLEPIEGGDRYNEPLNMAPVGPEPTEQEPKPDEPQQEEDATEEPNEEAERQRADKERKRNDADRLNPLLHDAVRRMLVKEVNAIRRAVANGHDLNQWAGDWYEKHAELVRTAVLPSYTVYEASTATGRAADFATKHVEQSKRDIADAVTFDAVEDLYENWINVRPFKADLAEGGE